MLTCRQLTERVTDYVEGSMPRMQQLQVKLHLAMCRHCRAYLRQLKMTTQVLDAASKRQRPHMPGEQREALMTQFRAMHGGDRRPPPRPSLALRWLARLDGLASKFGWVVAAMVALAAIVGVLAAGQSALGIACGARCLLVELGLAGVVLGGLAVVTTPRHVKLSRSTWMVCAMGGALLGLIALHFQCPMAHALRHVSVVHLGGVLCAGALGFLVARPHPA